MSMLSFYLNRAGKKLGAEQKEVLVQAKEELRQMPQMKVFVVGLPAKILLTFLVVGASLPFVGAQLTHDLRTSVEQSLRALGGG